MTYSFDVTAEYGNCFTPNAGPLPFPYFYVPVQLYDHGRNAFDADPIPFFWDSAASFLSISRDMATSYGIHFDDNLDRVRGGFDGLGGNRAAWLTTTRVQFPHLVGTRQFLSFAKPRPANLYFDFTVVIIDGLTVPLLGVSDVVRNFTVTTRWEGCHFHLNADHLGTPV